VEREDVLGGNLRSLRYFVSSNGAKGEARTPQEYLTEIVYKTQQHPQINVYLDAEVLKTSGFKGNFTTTLTQAGKEFQVQHGAVIVATGGVEYKGQEYCYGKDPRIVTQLEFENQIADPQIPVDDINSIVMIQCVGPSEKYCSRMCCTTALKNALKLKELNPEAQVTILYRDIRTYGFKERLYTQAREAGVRFIHFDFDRKPQVEIVDSNTPITIRLNEQLLDREIVLNPDLLILSTPIVAPDGAHELASRLKLSIDMDGFFLEAHVKLRPVDFAAEGIFMAGLAHYPKLLDETIAQALAAASRAAGILSQKSITTNARVASVDPAMCVGCLTCVRICPYEVPRVKTDLTGIGEILGAAFIEPAICHGCGTCVSECPARAIQLMHYTDAQTLNKIDAMFDIVPCGLLDSGLVPISSIEVRK
jgi:heterodisulfide reductase subunit A-like polyferredoxin